MLVILAMASFIVAEPPARYNRQVRNLRVIEGTTAEVGRVCRLASRRADKWILACAIPSKKMCIVIWPKALPRDGPLWRHELAHCNGWPQSHPRF